MTDVSSSMNEALTGVRAIYDLLTKTNDAQLTMAISSEASKVQTALIGRAATVAIAAIRKPRRR